MKKVRITVMKMGCYPDLMAEYENPMEHPCDMVLGQVFVADGWNRPEGLCLSAWESMSPFVLALASGGENLYAGWMKNPRSAMISCNDGFRPGVFSIALICFARMDLNAQIISEIVVGAGLCSALGQYGFVSARERSICR